MKWLIITNRGEFCEHRRRNQSSLKSRQFNDNLHVPHVRTLDPAGRKPAWYRVS
jgi:hypothetical protein